jgi:hypothetical protein
VLALTPRLLFDRRGLLLLAEWLLNGTCTAKSVLSVRLHVLGSRRLVALGGTGSPARLGHLAEFLGGETVLSPEIFGLEGLLGARAEV